MTDESYRLEPIPRSRLSSIDAGRLSRRRHSVHALIEADVTEARRLIHREFERTGEKLSFTAFLVHCLGRAIETNPRLHAYRNWRNQLVIYDEVNVVVMMEVEKEGRLIPMPKLLKGVNKRSCRELSQEIRTAQKDPRVTQGWTFLSAFFFLPFFLRNIFYWIVKSVPQSFRQYSSSVMVTAVGMFGHGGGWGIPATNFTLTITAGGIDRKPGVVEDRIEIREYLDLTISVDHDIVDGAPIARFIQQFRNSLEEAQGLPSPS